MALAVRNCRVGELSQAAARVPKSVRIRNAPNRWVRLRGDCAGVVTPAHDPESSIHGLIVCYLAVGSPAAVSESTGASMASGSSRSESSLELARLPLELSDSDCSPERILLSVPLASGERLR